jgi:hypothetical protein
LSRDAFVRYARRECGAFSAWQFGGTGVSDAVTEFLVREMNAKERIGRRELNSWRILNLAFFTFGKKADILRCGRNVCFTPPSGHWAVHPWSSKRHSTDRRTGEQSPWTL